MVKKDLRKMKSEKTTADQEVIEKAQEMMGGKKLDISEKELDNFNKIAEMTKQYEGKSEQELTNELLRLSEQGRQDGTLNNEMLETFYRSIAPMMSGEQKNKLDSLMKMLKRETP